MRFRFHALVLVAASLFASCAHAPAPAPVDRGFLTTDEDSNAATALHWPIDELPIPVLVSPDMPAHDVELVREKVRYLNEVIGTRVFDNPITSGERIATRVEVAEMQPLVPLVYVYTMQFWNGRDRQAETRTYYTEDGVIEASVIRLPSGPNSPASDEMVLHELGHALGLTHDDQGPSVMSPRVNPAAHGARYVFDTTTMSWRYSFGFEKTPQTLTAHDVQILRDKYGLN